MTANNLETQGWCILRTSGPKTLPLARSLVAANIEAWTPTRTIKRPRPGQRRQLVLGLRREMVEVSVAILPSFVFVRARYLDDLFRIGALPLSPHPSFSIFHDRERVPVVTDASVSGLRDAESEAAAAIQEERDEETRKAARQERANRLGSERARLKALRSERKVLTPRTDVTVDDMPALAGIVGTIVEGHGTSAEIHFGGSLTMTVEAWRVRPYRVGTDAALTGAAA
jgi:hypothetical protein